MVFFRCDDFCVYSHGFIVLRMVFDDYINYHISHSCGMSLDFADSGYGVDG